MPFTPFHFGPGFLVKSFLVKRFHFLSFVLSQVLIDCETAYNILQQNARLHTFFHTYLGSLAIIPIAFGVLKASEAIAFKVNLPILRSPFSEKASVKIILISLWIGAWSHVLFDSIMHSDVRPFWPFINTNEFNDIIDVDYLHLFCVISGMAGLLWANKEEVKKGFK